MQIVMSATEQNQLIDIAMKEGVHGVKEFQMWLIENRDKIIDMYQPSYCTVYGADV
jgi:hypothetical protein